MSSQTLASACTPLPKSARFLGRVGRTPAAEELWAAQYADLTPDDMQDGPVAQVVARAVPQVLLLSLVYALLDGARQVDVAHLAAALALWSYVRCSAGYVFGDTRGNPDLYGSPSSSAPPGQRDAPGKAVSVDLFARHRTAEQLDALLDVLTKDDEYRVDTVPTAGRSATRYVYAKKANQAKEAPLPSQLRATSPDPEDFPADLWRGDDTTKGDRWSA